MVNDLDSFFGFEALRAVIFYFSIYLYLTVIKYYKDCCKFFLQELSFMHKT